MSDEKTPVAYLHQVVCGDGEPDQALSFEPDNFPLAGVLGYRSLSHEPLFRAPLHNEMERLRNELGRAYRALHAFAFADREGKRLNETAVMYHSPTIGAAARFVHEGALDGSEYFIGKTVDVLHAALRGEQRFSLHDLKRKGITDTEGTRADKQDASGHRTEAMLDVYDHSRPVVKPARDG